jgi:hypothetical protein
MTGDDEARKIPVKKGSAGAARSSDPGRRPAEERKPSKEDLDERQERLRPTRRRGPPLDEGVGRSRAERKPPDVPETECEEPGGGE